MINTEPVTYWKNEPSNGIVVDWAKVRATFKRIVRKKYHHLIDYDFEKYSYNIWVSERTGNKTTQIVLIALIAYAMYGVQLEYIRITQDQTTPKKLSTLYASIVENGYLQAIFGEDSWNDIQYRGGYFRLIKRDADTGKPEIVDNDYITHVIVNDRPDEYKSSYNTIRGDIVFFDEFVSIKSSPAAHYYFKQNLATVLRKRLHGVIFMAANNLNFNNDFYADFRIRRDILQLDMQGDIAEIEKGGTRFFFRIIPPDLSAEKKKYNKKYFGYSEEASAITGGSWEMREYQHIRPEWKAVRPLVRNYYISHLGDLLRLTICKPEKMGTIVLVTPATRIYDDSRIFTVGDIYDKRYIYKCGSSSAGYNIFWALFKKNRWYYATNECGELVEAFIKAASRVT